MQFQIVKIAMLFRILFVVIICSFFTQSAIAKDTRKTISLNQEWTSIADDHNIEKYNGFEQNSFNDKKWQKVNVPHNWDKYEGYRRLLHGNRHGYAWYRKSFKINEIEQGKRFFLFFEGVGSYATVWLNGENVGYHAGGRTTFTLDVTDAILKNNKENILAVRADHPAEIRDLPWVDGGCSTERGFSEGSQPMGIFRPVSLIITNDIKVEPFGVHVWNDENISAKEASLNLTTEFKNYGLKSKNVTVKQDFLDAKGKVVFSLKSNQLLKPNQTIVLKQSSPKIAKPNLWSVENPYLYTLKTTILEKNKIVDEVKTPYGIRWISWPKGLKPNQTNQFYLNGKPVFINGIAEYEHLIGNSHAFSDEQVYSRVSQMKAAGFNSFRDGHQPHNLRYNQFWDQNGILLWTQMAAHIWFDNPAFKENFKTLLKDWVKERRNSPSVILWGLENESTLPEDFSRECTEIIRKLDPTASIQRLVTTCNGGSGTDWDVPQNWTGTYGGDHNNYGEDLKRQILVGEYGAWRTLDYHSEGPHLPNVADYNEDRFVELMETKVRLADSVKNEVAGHYFWLWTSHDNPGRVQGGEGLRELDRIGPVNYKGLLTPWEEPTDAFYMFRSNFAPKVTEPMIYIASHTWPQRWTEPGIKNNIRIYSNCDEVELFNDIDGSSLGKQKHPGFGKHFRFDNVNIQYNVLYAVGYINGKAVAKDTIVLMNLPQSPNFYKLYENDRKLTLPKNNYNYIYRVNCGGPDFTDENGNLWLADKNRDNKENWGSSSWTKNFEGIPAFFASQRRTFDPIKYTKDWPLFQTFRYGLDQLKFEFPVVDGEYLIELYFNEPWLGTGDGLDATGWRLFDVAINNEVVLKDLDIWKEVGHDSALKKTVKVKVIGGELVVSFPNVKAGQALISAIAIVSLDQSKKVEAPNNNLIKNLNQAIKVNSWLDIGQVYDAKNELSFLNVPSALFGANYFYVNSATSNPKFEVSENADVYIISKNEKSINGFDDTQTQLINNKNETHQVFIKRFKGAEEVNFTNLNIKDFIVAVNTTSALQPAFDLKTSTQYKANTQPVLAGVERVEFLDQVRLRYKVAKDAVVEWTVKVGVADVYSLTFKYHNPFKENRTAWVEVIAADGTVMRSKTLVDLEPTRDGKWNYINTSTGTMVNAGTYKVRLIAENALDIYVDAVDVQ
jgi:beta-galactosidase